MTNLRRFLRSAGLSGLSALLLAGCLGKPAESGSRLPPVTDAPTGERLPGKAIWHDLLTPDLSAAREFYGELFGWSFEQKGARYLLIRRHGRLVGGILSIPASADRTPAARWMIALSTTNLPATLRDARAMGGRIVYEPPAGAPRGDGALLADPSGAHVFLLNARDGDPKDVRPATGEWLWNELWTTNLEREVDFYRHAIPYAAIRKGDGYVVLLNDAQWRIGIRSVEDASYAGRWVPAVRVADPMRMAKKAEALGGKLLLPPDPARRHGNAALVADPGGALLILQRWDFSENDEGDTP